MAELSKTEVDVFLNFINPYTQENDNHDYTLDSRDCGAVIKEYLYYNEDSIEFVTRHGDEDIYYMLCSLMNNILYSTADDLIQNIVDEYNSEKFQENFPTIYEKAKEEYEEYARNEYEADLEDEDSETDSEDEYINSED